VEDECHLVWGEVWGMVWGKRHMLIEVPMTTERQRQTSYGASNLLPRAVPLKAEERGNGETTVAYIQWGQRLYPGKRLLFLWDGASYPRSTERQAFLAPENAGLCEEQGHVTCLLFAPNAPEQNPAEELWLKGKTHLRKHFALNKTFAHVKHCFTAFLESLNFDSVKVNWYWPTPQLN
jgi:transposase